MHVFFTRCSVLLIAVATTAVIFPSTTWAQDYVVAFTNATAGPTRTDIVTSVGGTVIRELPQLDAVVVRPTTNVTGPEFEQSLADDPRVRYVEPDLRVTVAGSPDLQGQQYPLPIVRAPSAWLWSTGTNATVAVVDTGIDYTHSDFAGRVLPGWDFFSNDADPMDGGIHGTHVAGIIGASASDHTGISGIAPTVSLLPVKSLGSSSFGSQSLVAQGIVYAADHGADVINLSLKADDGSVLQDALRYALRKDALPVCAAGNDNEPDSMFPARYPECLAVAATSAQDTRASFSNYGPSVDISAPGEQVLSDWPGETFGTMSGTSMGTAAVSGTAALLATMGLHAEEIRSTLLRSSSDKGSPGWDPYYGAGRLDTRHALEFGQLLRLGTTPQIDSRNRHLRCGSTFKLRCKWNYRSTMYIGLPLRGTATPFVPIKAVAELHTRRGWTIRKVLRGTATSGSDLIDELKNLPVGQWRVRVATSISLGHYQYFEVVKAQPHRHSR